MDPEDDIPDIYCFHKIIALNGLLKYWSGAGRGTRNLFVSFSSKASELLSESYKAYKFIV